jgi:hypothetical protein
MRNGAHHPSSFFGDIAGWRSSWSTAKTLGTVKPIDVAK